MHITDAQIHLWTNDQAPSHHQQHPLLIEDALQQMQVAGVNSAINHPPPWDPESNEYAVEAAQLHPEKFATLGWFPLDGTADEAVVDQLLARPGMVGLRFIMAMPDKHEPFLKGDFDWLWAVADQREIPVGLFVLPNQFQTVAKMAERYPKMRLLIDHLSAFPFSKLPDAMAHLDALIDLARYPNIAVKATGVPSISTQGYPFADTHDLLHRIFDAFGAKRMYWGSDITRLQCSWQECITLFTEELPWLKGSDLEWVMGRGVREWIGWNTI